jgi:hypothetical protein
MDEVDFAVRSEHHPPVGYWSVVDIRVNGVRLQELVKKSVEGQSTHADTVLLGGQYMGLDPATARGGHFLGGPVTMSIQGRPILERVLLRCTCGEPGCDAVSAEVRVEQSQVTWEKFRAGGVPLPIGPYVFSRQQYDEALQRAAQSQSG